MVHLVNMPFLSLTNPTLALGLIKAHLTQAEMASRVFNLNLHFSRRIGFGGYQMLAMFKGFETQVGEWLFAEQAWGSGIAASEEEFLDLCGDELEGIPNVKDPRAWLRFIRSEVVPPFLRECIELLEKWGEPRVVGFSCTFFQTIASLALGRLLKKKYPAVKLVYGGSCFHGEMGLELMNRVPWIDAVSTGEADDVIVPLFRSLSQGQAPFGLQGVLYRDRSDQVQMGPPHQPVSRAVIEKNPHPDFDDFFRDARYVGLDRIPEWQERLLLPFESSRGCWWGQKQHCTFCGLNGEGMEYRSKSSARVRENLSYYVQRYAIRRFQASDNILAMQYFHDLLPELRDNPLAPGVELFYSVKANMNRQRIRVMSEAGIAYVQPGIESLSSHLADLMRKGVSALQNVFFLKCCREYGIEVYWNNLIRIPGEQLADYRQMEEWIPKLVHLRPPFGGAPKVECHRFSPYFFEPHRWNDNLRPRPWYRGLYPETVNLSRVAYYFDADWKDTLGDPAYDGLLRATLEWSRIWREQTDLPVLSYRLLEDGCLEISDTRDGKSTAWTLTPEETLVYQAIDEPIGLTRLTERVSSIPPAKLQAILAQFRSRAILLQEGDMYVGIALADWAPVTPFRIRRGRLKRITNQNPTTTAAAFLRKL